VRRTFIFASIMGVALSAPVAAQDHHSHHAPYAGLQAREIKALSSEEVDQLKSGAGMGLAQAAELNHYPGPKHVLELAEELGLTDEQRGATKLAFDAMKFEAVALGEKILQMESHLDGAFADGTIDEEQLGQMTAHIANLRGELRAVHLKAHLAMKQILTDEQVAAYDRLRGYGPTDAKPSTKK